MQTNVQLDVYAQNIHNSLTKKCLYANVFSTIQYQHNNFVLLRQRTSEKEEFSRRNFYNKNSIVLICW